MNLFDISLRAAYPLTSPLLVLLCVLVVIPRLIKQADIRTGIISAFVTIGSFVGLYHLLSLNSRMEHWLSSLNSPMYAAFVLIALPAIYLPRNKWYKLFLLLPSACVLLLCLGVYEGYRTIPDSDKQFCWFLVRPSMLIAGVVSLLVLVQPILRIGTFRIVVRWACLIVLLYGGFVFRKNYTDYSEMQSRRAVKQDLMMLQETTPVMKYDNKISYLPSAPCRFAKDGGYVQGCNMELAQRMLQLNYMKMEKGDPSEINAFGIVLAALTSFVIISFVLARWFCGWLCPLSSMGELLNWLRKVFGFAPCRPAPSVKMMVKAAGVGVSGVAMGMAAAYPFIDTEGKIFGTKIPVYPFCKICPSQQLCPMAAGGPAAYPPVPGMEWAHGFFRYGCLTMVAFYVLCFAFARRLWCRFCPMGMISGVFNRGGMFELHKKAEKCNKCGMCAETCPMDIQKVRDEMKETNVGSFDCVLCLRCVEKCPRDGCLSLKHGDVKIFESKFGRDMQ